jgi:hypothetical protein
MINSKLTFEQMTQMISLFAQHKLSSLRIGDFEISKSHYEQEGTTSALNNKEDPLFFSAPQLPPDVQEYLLSTIQRK